MDCLVIVEGKCQVQSAVEKLVDPLLLVRAPRQLEGQQVVSLL